WSEVPELKVYHKYELLGLGHKKRAEIVEKWISLGVEEFIDERDLYAQCDDFKYRLDSIIRKNIVPPKPIYVLILLQMFEAYSQQNLELTSHGHCYQQLVYQAFDNAGIPKDEVDRYLNVLTELAWDIHLNQDGLDQYQVKDFFIK
ncbi:TPA: toll-Interleukin receptor, partial [Yersinia enterocolitica]|nr:toll-Interleukin receptor [Yersinia enterocolitica]